MSSPANDSTSSLTVDAELDDARLLERIRAGDETAFRALYHRHVRAVYQYSLSICRSDPLARESTQEVWIAFWTSRQQLVLTGDSALPWLLVTSRHKSLNRIRGRHEQSSSIEDLSIEPAGRLHDPVLDAEARALADHVRTTVATMSEVDRRIFQLCVAEGMTYQSASRALHISEGVLRNRLSRLRNKLRHRISEFGEDR